MTQASDPRGRFITIEGSEGVGKTTNVALVRGLLEADGHTVITTREPGGTPLAEQIRDTLLTVRDERLAPTTELLLMFAARAQHVDSLIRPALARGDWVLSDRFTDATFAYQGGGRGLPVKDIELLETLVHADLQPDLTLYLDVPVEIALERIADREHDRFEREPAAFFHAVRNAYLERARRFDRFAVIDAGRPLIDVEQQIRRTVALFLEGTS